MSGHTAFRALPVVDLGFLADASPAARADGARALRQAAREAGFFYVVGHGVPADLINRLIGQASRFFALPLAVKMASYIGASRHHRGYVPEGEEVFYGGSRDRKEAFDLAVDLPADAPEVRAGTPLLGPNVWPELSGFREDVTAYYQAVFALGRRLLRGFALALGLADTAFDHFVTCPPSQLRLVHYPPSASTGPGEGLGIGAHTDYECFTILLPTASGLEVLNGVGEWVDAPPLPGAFIVNIGDMMEVWTNGELVATSHRVRLVSEERFSFPLFFACDYHTVVEPLPPFVGPDRPTRYAPIAAGDHLWAQTIQSFTYLKERLARGEVVLPAGARPLSSFGQEAVLERRSGGPGDPPHP
jgi:isopenicillin N synthase-like dioxygenase